MKKIFLNLVLILFAHVMHCQTGKWIIPLSLDNSADFPVEVSFSNQNPPIVSNEMISEPFDSPTLISYGGFADNFDRKFCFTINTSSKRNHFQIWQHPYQISTLSPFARSSQYPGKTINFRCFTAYRLILFSMNTKPVHLPLIIWRKLAIHTYLNRTRSFK